MRLFLFSSYLYEVDISLGITVYPCLTFPIHQYRYYFSIRTSNKNNFYFLYFFITYSRINLDDNTNIERHVIKFRQENKNKFVYPGIGDISIKKISQRHNPDQFFINAHPLIYVPSTQ